MARLINPLSGMLLLVAIYSAYSAMMAAYGEYASEAVYSVFDLGFRLLLMWWVYVDRHRRRHPVPFEFEAFVFFAPLFVVPYYLFRTRGMRAAPLCIALAVVVLIPFLSALMADIIFWQ